MKQSLFKVFFVVGILLLAFSNCDFSLNRSRQYSIVSPDELSQIPADDFFYINIKSAFYTGEGFDPLDFVFYAREEGPGADCKVRFTEENSSTEDLFCMLEVSEGDLYLHDINIEYNVPPGMCHYLSFRPHWHYNQKTGIGPKYVVETGGETISQGSTSITRPTIYHGCDELKFETTQSYTCEKRSKSGDSWGEWADAPDEYSCTTKGNSCSKGSINNIQYEDDSGDKTTNSADAVTQYRCESEPVNTIDTSQKYCPQSSEDKEKACEYNKSGRERSGLGNCCLGTYTNYKVDPIDKKYTTGEQEDWGGDIKNCIGGLARLNWSAFDDNGFPIPLVAPSGSSGVRETYELPNLLSKNKTRHSLPTANFYTGIGEEDESTSSEYRNKSELTPEDAGEPNNYCNKDNEKEDNYKFLCSGGVKSYPYITWSCLDQNYEVRHQIHLIIREWNTQEEFLSFKESNGSSGDPDTGGDEGDGCDYYTANTHAQYFGACNDLTDLDDQDDKGSYPNLPYQGAGGGGSSR